MGPEMELWSTVIDYNESPLVNLSVALRKHQSLPRKPCVKTEQIVRVQIPKSLMHEIEGLHVLGAKLAEIDGADGLVAHGGKVSSVCDPTSGGEFLDDAMECCWVRLVIKRYHDKGSENSSPNVEVWHRLPGAPLRNRVKGYNYDDHLDSERVAGCPPPSCSALVGFVAAIRARSLEKHSSLSFSGVSSRCCMRCG